MKMRSRHTAQSFTGETPVPRWFRGMAVPAMIQNLTDLWPCVHQVDLLARLGIFETDIDSHWRHDWSRAFYRQNEFRGGPRGHLQQL